MQNHNVIFKFPSGTPQVAAQLALTAGRCTVLTGKNGSGKTTVLSTLAGALAPEGGDLSLVRPVLAFTDIERQMHHRMTAVENLQYLSALFGQPGRRREARDALLRVGLDDQADMLAARLSKGQKKRLVMAMIGAAPCASCDTPRWLMLTLPPAIWLLAGLMACAVAVRISKKRGLVYEYQGHVRAHPDGGGAYCGP